MKFEGRVQSLHYIEDDVLKWLNYINYTTRKMK